MQVKPEEQKPKKKKRIIPEEGQPEWVNFSLKKVKAEPKTLEPEEMETVELKPIPDVEEVVVTEVKPKPEELEWESLDLKPIEPMDRPVLEKPESMEFTPLKKKKKRPKKKDETGKEESDTDRPSEDEQKPTKPDTGATPEVCRPVSGCIYLCIYFSSSVIF